MLRHLLAFVLCGLIVTNPARAQPQQGNETRDGSLICFFVLMEASFHQASGCGRRFSEVETGRYQRIYRRMEGYLLERGGPRVTDILQSLRQQVARGAAACSDASLPLANRFIDEVIGDERFSVQMEETLARDPNPLAGGCF
jgi:hypothetical protein